MSLLDEIKGQDSQEVEDTDEVQEESTPKRKPRNRVLVADEISEGTHKDYMEEVNTLKDLCKENGWDWKAMIHTVNKKYLGTKKASKPAKELNEKEQRFVDLKTVWQDAIKAANKAFADSLESLAEELGFEGNVPTPTRTAFLAKSEEFKDFLSE